MLYKIQTHSNRYALLRFTFFSVLFFQKARHGLPCVFVLIILKKEKCEWLCVKVYVRVCLYSPDLPAKLYSDKTK